MIRHYRPIAGLGPGNSVLRIVLATLVLLSFATLLPSPAEGSDEDLYYADPFTDPIRATIYSLPSSLVTPARAAALLRAVREHAPEREIVVLVDPVMDRKLQEEAGSLRLHLVPTDGRVFSPWPRDPFSTVHDPDGGLILHDRPNSQPGREIDAEMAEVLARGLPEELVRSWGGVRRKKAALPFHNGHVLMAGGAAWVSLHSLEPRILEILDLDRVPAETFGTAEGIDAYLDAGQQAIRDFSAFYGKPVRLVHPLPRSGPLPDRVAKMRAIGGGGPFDLDSLLTLLPGSGKGPEDDLRALVGDPGAGLRLLSDLSPRDWTGLAETYGLEIPEARPSGPLIAYQTGSRATWLGRFLDLVAERLADRGIAVERLPLILVPTRLLPDPDRYEAPDFILGWNNVVLQVREDRVIAEGFSSGLPSADRRAREIYGAAGTRLQLLPPLVGSITGNGGYRCASNQVRRPVGLDDRAQRGADRSRELVRDEFESICRRPTESDNLFFGRALLERVTKTLAEADQAPPELQVRLRGWRGSHLFLQGRVSDAIEQLEEARRLLDRVAPQLTPEIEKDLRKTVLRALAVARLQLAEDQNCLARHTPASCILPLADEAVHRLPREARKAGDLYLELLALAPGDIEADQDRWLLNLSRMLSDDYPRGIPEELRLPPDALSSARPFRRLRNIAPELGIDAVDLAGGAVMEDFDGDGLLDLVSGTWDPCEPMKAFRNDGQGGFVDVTADWGLDTQLGAFNLESADFDGDGMVDLLALRGGWLGEDGKIRNSLLRNDLNREAGRFVDVTVAAGLAYPAYPTQTAGWADYDGDGDLDLYVGNETRETDTVDPQTLSGNTEAYPSQLFRNEGDGSFTEVAGTAGVTNDRYAKSVAWGDYDDDGDPDLYVSNIGPNRLYRNEGPGEDGTVTFTDVAPDLGVVEPAAQSFGSWFFDYDNDGDLDLWVNRYGALVEQVSASYLGHSRPGQSPVLYRNDGGRFTDVSERVGLERPLLPMGANYGDLDSDGYPDVYLGTGVPDPDALMPNVLYHNDSGRRFVDVTFAAGVGHLQKGHGIAFGDLDHDGDLDLFEQMGGAFPFDTYGNVLYENPGPAGSWIVLRLVGRKANRFGVGGRIEIRIREGDESRSVHAHVGTGGSFGSSSLQQEIGLGEADAIERIVMVWPGSGTRQVFDDVAPNRYYRLTEGADELVPLDLPEIELGAGSPDAHPRHTRGHDHASDPP